MTVHMDVEEVRAGGNRLRLLSTTAADASQRVEAPAATAADQNPGFTAGQAGRRWQAALANVTSVLEQRVDWQGEQVVWSANDTESGDQESGDRFARFTAEITAVKA